MLQLIKKNISKLVSFTSLALLFAFLVVSSASSFNVSAKNNGNNGNYGGGEICKKNKPNKKNCIPVVTNNNTTNIFNFNQVGGVINIYITNVYNNK